MQGAANPPPHLRARVVRARSSKPGRRPGAEPAAGRRSLIAPQAQGVLGGAAVWHSRRTPPNVSLVQRLVEALGDVVERWFPWGNRRGGGSVEDAYRAKLEALERVYRRSLKPKA